MVGLTRLADIGLFFGAGQSVDEWRVEIFSVEIQALAFVAVEAVVGTPRHEALAGVGNPLAGAAPLPVAGVSFANTVGPYVTQLWIQIQVKIFFMRIIIDFVSVEVIRRLNNNTRKIK